MCRKQAESHLTCLSSQVPLQAYLYAERFLCAVLRSITTIFASKMGKGMNSRENKAGSVASPVLILFPDSLWPYPYKVLISIRTITIRGFMLPKKDLLYTFYTPSFYGRGIRYSAHIRCDLNKTFMFLVKFGQTVYQDRATIGSGNDLIEGNTKTDLQMQLRIKF